MGLMELFEVGFFTAFWNWSSPILTALVYFFAVVGAVLQLMLLKRCRKSALKWLLAGICGTGILISECAWHTITGWDRLAVDIIYGLLVCSLLGAVITAVICQVQRWGKTDNPA